MAYAAVISLKQTIQRLIHSLKFSLDSSGREILGLAYKEATSLQQVLKTVDHDGGGGRRSVTLEGQIREEAEKLEDFLELHQSNLVLEASSSPPSPTLLLDSEQLRQEISLFAEKSNKLAEDYAAESDNDREEDAAAYTGFGEEMVGFDKELINTKFHLRYSAVRPDDWGVVAIVGPIGSGRSYVVRSIFEDDYVELSFDLRIWVSVGSNYECVEILELILTQALATPYATFGRMVRQAYGEEAAKNGVINLLEGRRYMMVLDDVCDTQILDYLYGFLPVQDNGSVTVVTTGKMEIAGHMNRCYSVYTMEDVHVNFEDIYGDAFRRLLGPLLPEMEEASKKIIRNCRGLRICLSKVLVFLWSVDKSPEAWNQLADEPHHPLFHIVDESSEMRKLKEDFANLLTLDSYKACLSSFVEDCGFSNDIEFIKKKLFPQRFFPNMEVISFVGMAGIGKTIFVKKIFEYIQSLSYLDCYVCAWVTLGPTYRPQNILIDILAQIDIEGDDEIDLVRKLSQKKFLIVLDDAWNIEPLHYLAKLFPNIKGRALLTTS